ncbi:MAG: gluconokinase [Planctomycetes bacterium]|nr:gluconokinase [Planctomycetota bacterium]
MLTLALDLGTSSCRSALFDVRGRRLLDTTAQQSYPLQTDKEGKAELDAATVLHALRTCITTTLVAHDGDRRLRSQPIVAVGTSCFGHSLIGTDGRGRAMTTIITWADSRMRQTAGMLRERFDERKSHARSGCMIRASFWPAKLRWLAKTKPALVKRVKQWMSPAEWLYQQFCGEVRIAHGMATGTGLYNPRTRAYDPELLKLAGVSERVLPVIGDEPLHLLPDLANEWPALRDAHWFPAIFDGAASNLGSGATTPGCAAINVGTSAAARIMYHTSKKAPAKAPFGLFCYRVDAERHLIGGAVSNAGNLRAWCLRELQLPDDPDIIEEVLAKRRTPDHGLLVLPFWNAERAPNWREDAGGTVVGITQATTAMDLLQAITESSYYRLATIVDYIPAGTSLRILVGGGIQKSPSSLQRLADVMGRPLTALDEPEASLRGAAIFSLERLGHHHLLAPATGRTVKPDKQRAKRYAIERARMTELCATIDLVRS